MNMFKTTMLLAMLTALFMSVGMIVGGSGGAILAFVLAAAMNLFTYWNADKIVLRMHRAVEIDGRSHPKLYAMVERLVQRASMPMPKVYIVEEANPNAFATGRNPDNAAVAVTTGLMNRLNAEELEGVLAHELAHIRNRDTLIMTMVATIAGALSMLANFAMWFRFGDSRGMGAAGFLAILLAPFAAMIVQMAISRAREYSADATGAEIAGNPHGLASALAKISRASVEIPNRTAQQNPAAAQLYIAPLALGGLFSTHPPTEKRIEALMSQAQAQAQVTQAQAAPTIRMGTGAGSALQVSALDRKAQTSKQARSHANSALDPNSPPRRRRRKATTHSAKRGALDPHRDD